jgi:hypothetical protein
VHGRKKCLILLEIILKGMAFAAHYDKFFGVFAGFFQNPDIFFIFLIVI